MLLSYEHVGSKKPAKINTYMLTRAELLITLCYEIPCIYSARNRWKSLPQLRTSIRTLHYVHPSIHLVNQDMYMWPWKVMTNLVTQCFNRKKTDELRQKRLYLLINATSCSNNYLVISISLGSSFNLWF